MCKEANKMTRGIWVVPPELPDSPGWPWCGAKVYLLSIAVTARGGSDWSKSFSGELLHDLGYTVDELQSAQLTSLHLYVSFSLKDKIEAAVRQWI